MERRVIKFNLMGAIFVLILIISIIVGIIIFAINKNGGDKENKNDSTSGIQENKDSYAELDTKEKVLINNENVEVTMRTYESKLGYKSNYAIDKFYIDSQTEEKDVLKSLESNTIALEITKGEGNFKEKSEELIANQAEKRKSNASYKMNAKSLNEKDVYYWEVEEVENNISKKYYVQNGDSYFLVLLNCDKQFANEIIPIVDKMIESIKTN